LPQRLTTTSQDKGARRSRRPLGLKAPLARAEIVLQRWPIAGIALLALMLVLGTTLVGQNL
jgi:hypothetical protein